MAKESKLGDKMPNTRDPKWGSMRAGESHLSDEWHDMEPSSAKMSEKWVDMDPSAAIMSEKWADMEAGTPMGNQFHEMKQEKRDDPYSMAPSSGDRSMPDKVGDKSPMPGNKKSRATQHTEFGSTREI